MFLILKVVSANAAVLGAGSQAVFTAAGGSIGRRPGNDWVLADGHVSGRHARVRAIGGTFFLEDNESGNGVVVNGNRLHPGEPFPLKDGDKVFIDPFEISVAVSMTRPGAGTEVHGLPPPAPPRVAAPAFAGLEQDPIAPPSRAGGDLLADIAVQPSGFGDIVPGAGGALPSDFNPLLDDAPVRPAPPAYSAADLQAKPVLHDVLDINPTPVSSPVQPLPPGGVVIPTDWDASSDLMSPARPVQAPPAASRSANPPAVTPAPAASPAVRLPEVPAAVPNPLPSVQISPVLTGAGDFGALLRAAGVPGDQVSPEVMAEFGQVLRVVIEGLMEVLRARGEIRNEFRLPQTTFKARDNNPLKMAVNAEDAVHNLLVKRNPAYLGTSAAFDDAFQDVRHHQLAMLAGMRAAYGFMLKRFDPAALKAQFDSKPGRKGFGFSSQARYWEAFEEYYREATADADDCFRRLFGDQFARAYEEQVQLLRSSRDSTRRET
jgi:type VI secretion system FHA domain protein